MSFLQRHKQIKIDRLKIQQVIRSILRFIIGLGGEKIQIK